MAKKVTFFDQNSDPLEARIAVGLNKVGLALKQQTWLSANEDGLSPTQGRILNLIENEGELSGKELAQKLGVSLPTVSASVRTLVDKKLLTKTPDPRHPRASLLKLTRTGRRRAEGTASWPEFLADAVRTLDSNEQVSFLSAIIKMIFALQEQEKIPLSRMCITCSYFRPNKHAHDRPHHCAYVDAPMKAAHLRLDCHEHELAEPLQITESWDQFQQAIKQK